MMKRILSYLVVLGVFGGLIIFLINKGNQLQKDLPDRAAIAKPTPVAGSVHLWDELVHNLQHPLGLLLLQILAIVLVASVFGRLARIVKQPRVVGEIVAGICLGPSLLGWIWPGSVEWLFPAESMKPLSFLSQIGLTFFMFVIGMQLDVVHIKRKAKHAVMISHVSIIFPFFLGVALAYYIYPKFGPASIGFLPFALFIGIAMSVTAFPVLARIVKERGLSGTAIGSMALTCAAADDITAWCILAVIVAIAKAGTLLSSLVTISLALIFIFIMLYAIKPWIKKRMANYFSAGNRKSVVVMVFILLISSSWITEIIGIHALFGSFLAGVIMPQNFALKKWLTDKVEDVSVLLLLPIFFASTGLRMQLGLIWQDHLWIVFGLIMLAAVAGKFAGSAMAARYMGESWPNAFTIGALMNTRGLMELVVLNIGYELGILPPSIFSMMVLMALLTTFMTGPLLNLFYRPEPTIGQQSAVVNFSLFKREAYSGK